MSYNKDKFYVVTGNFLLEILAIEKRLYGVTILSPDERRNIANLLNYKRQSEVLGEYKIEENRR